MKYQLQGRYPDYNTFIPDNSTVIDYLTKTEIVAMAKREIIELVKKYIILLNAEGISVNRAFLFGSYSNDTATDSSDIDVMIVSDRYDETDDLAVGKIWKLTRKVSTRIEPLLIGMKKFKDDNSSPLVSLIKTKGIEII